MTYRADQVIDFRTAGGGRAKARLHAWCGPAADGLYRLYARTIDPTHPRDPNAGRLVSLRAATPNDTPREVTP